MGRPKINMIGVQCNGWTVISEAKRPDYINGHTIWWNCQCIKCGRVKSFDGVEIRKQKIGQCICNNSFTNNQIKNEIGNQYGKLTVKSFAYIKDSKAYWNCQCDCGNITVVCGNHLRTGRTKSCGCVVSYKEQEIEQILKQHNISFKREYSFNDLVDNGYLRFDFAIFQNNKLYGLIEYQGVQHSEPPNQFNHHGLLQKHDKMKVDYCQEHNIPLLFLDKNSNLEQDILNWIS